MIASRAIWGNVRAVPAQVWLACALLATLRAIPFLITRMTSSAAGLEYIPVGYNPKDWLSYVAFIRQHELLMVNPFVTEPQGGRFILLFHTLLGKAAALTGVDPFLVLELSRVPLIFGFFYVLWRFLSSILPDVRQRVLACWLVAFSGGVEFVFLLTKSFLPGWAVALVAQDTWHLQGWNSFAAFYNPLWIAALTMSLLILRPILQPDAPSLRDRLVVGVGSLLLFFVHPYSMIYVIAVFFMLPLLGWALQRPGYWANSAKLALPLGLGMVVAGAITLWQLQDPIFKLSSGGAFGSQDISLFWYPLTLGALAIFALRGWRRWIEEGHLWRYSMGAWTIAVIALHSSPLLNGYHFVFYLHVPLCIVAAGSVARTFEVVRISKAQSIRAAGLLTVLFASSLSVTILSAQEAYAQSRAPADYLRVVGFLAGEAPGNVVAPPEIGNLIPAYTDHRVFSGQWFLTPDFEARNQYYWMLIREPAARAAELREFLAEQNIGYLVVPANLEQGVRAALDGLVARSVPMGTLAILVLVAK